jgi:anti-sigma B factor antagonist
MGLGYLLSVNKKLQSSSGKLVVCGLTGMVKEVFRLSGFNKLFAVYDTAEAAFEKL